MSQKPIVVVGAGPTGSLLGIELARRGADVRIIEKAPLPPVESRAGGVHSRSLELLARLGIVDELLAVGNRVRATNFYSGTRRILRVDYGHLDGPFPFMLHVPQYETQRVLDGCLRRLGVEVERGVELVGLSQDGSGVTLESEDADGTIGRLSASYAVGCDGAHSKVRHQLGMPFEGQAYEWEWLGADVEVDWAYPESEVHLFISRAGVLACLPFGGGRWRVISPKVDHAVGPAAAPNLDDVRAVVARRAPAGMQIDNPSWIGTFRASRRSAPHYRVGRVFLAGDAVHIHSPAAGQGMNTGLGDAANLGWKLGLVATGRAPESLLDTYEPERAPVARGVIALTHSVMRVFDATTRMAPLRDRAVPVLSASRFVQRSLAARFAQHWVSYRDGPLAGERSQRLRPLHAVRSGDRAPQVTGLRAGGTAASLFDLLGAREHTVFAFDDKSAARLKESLAPFEGAVRVFRVQSAEGQSPNRLADPAGRFVKRYGLRPGKVCAIRPDGYIAYIGDSAGLERYLSRCLLAAADGTRAGGVTSREPSQLERRPNVGSPIGVFLSK